MTLLVSIPAAILPTILLLRWFRNSDQFPEPWPTVRNVFWRGVWIVAPVIVVAYFLRPFQPSDIVWGSFYKAFMLAAVPEELFKYLVLILYCLRLKEFDEPIDGIVYGVTVSLGFATLENILYVINGGLSVAIMRALTAVPAHAMMGAIMGYFIAKTMLEPNLKIRYFALAFIIPVIIHGFYDLPLMYLAAARQAEVFVDHTLFIVLLWFAFLLISWRMALTYHQRLKSVQVNK